MTVIGLFTSPHQIFSKVTSSKIHCILSIKIPPVFSLKAGMLPEITIISTFSINFLYKLMNLYNLPSDTSGLG